MKRILCFGDSLTYGQVPGTTGSSVQRYDASTRWTQLLAQIGSDYEIIEEGLPSRTIDLDDPRPGKGGRNGKAYLLPCIESHLPLDCIIIWLGTNDMKKLYDRTATEIARSMQNLLQEVEDLLFQRESAAKLVLVSPPPFDDTNQLIQEWYEGTASKVQEVSALYKKLAEEVSVNFIDLGTTLEIPKSKDGIHLTEAQNKQVADIVREKLKAIL